jgi:glycosyltransferase involved in cell wall biosynthesis
MPEIDPVAIAGPRPFWSVMIPCFNSAGLLARTLESVLAQDPGPDVMQIEVVDDASTLDDPAAVVEGLAGSRVGYFRQPRNVGASANFTTCVRRSKGQWVHVLHSDDMVMPRYYERYRQQIEACPAARMVAAQTITTDAAERYLGVTQPVETDDGYMRDAAFVIATTNPLRCVSVVIARAAYETAGGFHPGLAHANDWEMWTRIASLERVAWVDEPFGLYRSHPDSDTNRLHRSTGYIDDCLVATEAIAGHFDDPEQRRHARVAARRSVSDYAVGVGLGLVYEGWFRLGVSNAVHAVRIDPSVHTLTRAVEVAHLAAVRRLGPRFALPGLRRR